MATTNLSSRGITISALLNVCGAGIPALIGIFAVPYLLTLLGIQRFGILSLCWALIGYFGALDMGLGRALTREVSVLLETQKQQEIPDLVWGVSVTVLILATPIALMIGIFSTSLVSWLEPSNAALAAEARWTLIILAGALPMVLFSAMLSGAIEGHHRFGLINAVRIPIGAINFLLPLGAATISPHLPSVVLAVVASRAIQLLALMRVCASIAPGAITPRFPKFSRVLPLFSFGKWLMVSSVVGPAMEYLDRFVVASVVGTAVVAYYTVPYDALTKVLIIPTAFSSVLFAAIAAFRASHFDRIVDIYRTEFLRMALLMVPLMVFFVLFAHEIMALWLDGAFAINSAHIAQVLALGILVNSFARIPFTHVQAEGRTDWSAKVHLLEVVPYLTLLLLATNAWGVLGAACIWALRAMIDTMIFYWLALRLRPRIAQEVLRQEGILVLLLIGLILVIISAPSLQMRAALAGVIVVTSMAMFGRSLLLRA
jgi:O-antigen/teichoic acid export membrane protein